MIGFLSAIVDGVYYTLALTFCSLLLGAIVAMPLCAMRESHNYLLRYPALSVIVFIRSVPPIVWLFLAFFGIGGGYIKLTPFAAATLALALISAANLAEIFRGALSAIHSGQYAAADALGLSQRAKFLDIVLPQAFRVSLPATTTYAIGLLKDTAIASTIGVQDIAFIAQTLTQRTLQGLEVYTASAVLYIGISMSLAFVSRNVEARIATRVAQ